MRSSQRYLPALPAALAVLLCGLACVIMTGCKSPATYRREADQAAASIIRQKQRELLQNEEPFTIETPEDALRRRLLLGQDLPRAGAASLGSDQLEPVEHWPEKDYPRTPDTSAAPLNKDEPVCLTLVDALQVAARNSRDYQSQKENLFRSALDLDLEADAFRSTFTGAISSLYSNDQNKTGPVAGLDNDADASWSRTFKNGATLSGNLAVDFAKLLTSPRSSSWGFLADASMSIPLLRGSGRHIVTEPLTQAERNVVYAMHTFERYKLTLAVEVASDYLAVLQQLDNVRNSEENYRRLITSARRARRLADAGRLPEIQVDQARQDELRARERWVTARESYVGRLDSFKVTLGLPTDASIELDYEELGRLAQAARERLGDAAKEEERQREEDTEELRADAPIELVLPKRTGGGPMEMDPRKAVELALEHRRDLRTSLGEVYDAQRGVVVAADALRAGLSLTGSAQAGESRSLGSAGSPDAHIRLGEGYYTAGAALDLPFERTSQRNTYRNSLITLERAVRSLQNLEDQVKLQVRNRLRQLVQARESIKIQAEAVQLAERRTESTSLFLQAGRAQIRDVLEAQEDLVAAQTALTAALVSYRVAELELQRDMGLLSVNEKGLWNEYSTD